MAGLGKVDDSSRKGILNLSSLIHHAQANITAIQTDAEISGPRSGAERELQRWVPDGPDPAIVNGNGNANGNARAGPSGRGGDSETFGTTTTGAWDQFETNKRLSGKDSTYDENLYTTRLDRSAPDYKKREKEADRLASEIQGVSSISIDMSSDIDGSAIFYQLSYR
jgi:PAB1-binding protein PBP1